MEKTIFILERIYRTTHIPIRYLDKTGKISLLSYGCNPDHDESLCDEDWCANVIQNQISSYSIPYLEFEEDFVYGILSDASLCNIILGPIRLNNPDTNVKHLHSHKYNQINEQFEIKHKTLDELSAALAIIYFAVTGKQITESEILLNEIESADTEKIPTKQALVQSYELDQTERELSRYSYSVEIDFTNSIRDGNPEGLAQFAETTMSTFEPDRIGKLAKSSFKQNEYMLIAYITLASRAAIEGGLDPLTSYLMSDLYLQQAESCKTISDIYRLFQGIGHDYAQQVKQKKEERSQHSYIEKCKNYIAEHLNQHFTVDEIANDIAINSSYLSRRFSESEGIGIQQYTQKKRVEAAENMLKYSDESIFVISNYLCFASQSYFGKVFKEHTGLTPQKYREKNKLIDF
ncbi:MAG: AraC family transcriptional regulator [Clostridiales Family XIII bacterium]|nr:AraC family transcriptional regulator [Clostridiales Family XIII bacterium]